MSTQESKLNLGSIQIPLNGATKTWAILEQQQNVVDPNLSEDIKNCMQEITPILEKYNLEIAARLQGARNGLIAVPELVRAKPK